MNKYLTAFWDSVFARKHTVHITTKTEYAHIAEQILEENRCRERRPPELSNKDQSRTFCYLAPAKNLDCLIRQLRETCGNPQILARPFSVYSTLFENYRSYDSRLQVFPRN